MCGVWMHCVYLPMCIYIDTRLNTLVCPFVCFSFVHSFSVNETVQLDQEVVKILGMKGVGCNKSHVVHVGCWNELTVARAQHVSLIE